ncbi:MAG: hypothetical protein AAF085_09945 [Planctomycetota bacterium]
MTEAQTRDQLRECQENNRLVTIRRNDLIDGVSEGFVIGLSNSLCLYQYFRDFFCDGYCVCRLQDITDIESGEKEAFFTRRAIALGYAVAGGTAPRFDTPLDSWSALLNKLQSENIHVGLHAEAEKSRAMTVGELIDVTNTKVVLRACSVLGEWHEENAVYEMDEISFLQFGDRYINAFQTFTEESS